MDAEKYKIADPLVEQLSEQIDAALDSEQLAELRRILSELAKALGPRYSSNLLVQVAIFDNDREYGLPLLNIGLSSAEDCSLYHTWGDSSRHRYLVEGDIQVVPHDYCPRCWKDWGFKLESLSCEHCGLTMGKDCKLLLDTDVCPHCEEGKVSISNPICTKCGFKVDTSLVSWG